VWGRDVGQLWRPRFGWNQLLQAEFLYKAFGQLSEMNGAIVVTVFDLPADFIKPSGSGIHPGCIDCLGRDDTMPINDIVKIRGFAYTPRPGARNRLSIRNVFLNEPKPLPLTESACFCQSIPPE